MELLPSPLATQHQILWFCWSLHPKPSYQVYSWLSLPLLEGSLVMHTHWPNLFPYTSQFNEIMQAAKVTKLGLSIFVCLEKWLKKSHNCRVNIKHGYFKLGTHKLGCVCSINSFSVDSVIFLHIFILFTTNAKTMHEICNISTYNHLIHAWNISKVRHEVQ